MPQTAIVKSVGAPVGGVNARDSLAAMPATDCVIADNWFGGPSYVAVRNGQDTWATGLPGAVETIMAYNGLAARKLFAVSGNSIYDITTPGTVGGAGVTALGNSRLQHQMFNAGGGNVLVWCNGAVQPQFFNGTVWGNTNITGSGLTPSNLITATVYQQRMWYIENNSMNVWYAGIQAFEGALSQLPLGGLFKLGGFLMQMATWTVDNVSGMNDYAVFITSEGEVAIYQGNDPNFASTWGLVGIFRIGRPIGRRCYTKVGSDVVVITADGLTPLSKAMLTDRTQQNAQLTYKILNAINQDVQAYNPNFGWQVIEYPLGNKLILNVPEIANVTMHQWVMNSVTQSWWRFKAWNANCWELQQDDLYYGGNGTVYLADTGSSDAGMAITWDCKPAFSYFDLPGQLKQFHMARPIFVTSAKIQPRITLNIDFNDVLTPSTPITSGSSSPWNTSPWNTTPWGGTTPAISVKNWIGVSGLGYAVSGRLSGQTSGIAVQWFSTDYSFTQGGPI